MRRSIGNEQRRCDDRAAVQIGMIAASKSRPGRQRTTGSGAHATTSRRFTKWKSGFWHIARAANVPVMCAYFHYPEKIIGLGAVFEMTPDLEADMARVRAFYRPWVGKHRGT